MGILAMQTFLVPIYHGLPVEVSFILDAASPGTLCEVDFCEEFLDIGEEFVE